MPRKKEDLALAWLQKSEEEKKLIRQKNAERMRLARAKKGIKKRSEMTPEELDMVRTKDRRQKRDKRKEMSEEEREVVKAKDRVRKAEGSPMKKLTNVSKSLKEIKNIDLKIDCKEQKKLKQLMNNCKIQAKIRGNRTEQETEEVNVDLVIRNRRMRSSRSRVEKILAAIEAKEGMRENRKFGFLREYKQRKRRDLDNPHSWQYGYSSVILSEYFKTRKEKQTKEQTMEQKKYRLKQLNKLRVLRHRKKVKKMLLEPLIIEKAEEKSEYELLRERNIQELERKKKESGLFD